MNSLWSSQHTNIRKFVSFKELLWILQSVSMYRGRLKKLCLIGWSKYVLSRTEELLFSLKKQKASCHYNEHYNCTQKEMILQLSQNHWLKVKLETLWFVLNCSVCPLRQNTFNYFQVVCLFVFFSIVVWPWECFYWEVSNIFYIIQQTAFHCVYIWS